MPYQVPPAVNYPTPLVAIPSLVNRTPPDGERMVPVEIDWGTMGGADHCVAINLQNNATSNFSQIVALSIDNSDCGADIRFVFPDSGETTTIPAYSPKVIIEVFTSMTQFFVVAGFNSEAVLNGDQTRFSILNFMPPPIAVPVTQEQAIAAVGTNATVASTQVVPATEDGTLEQAYMTFTSFSATAGNADWSLKDGTGKVLGIGRVANEGDQKTQLVIFQLVGVALRFSGGITLEIDNHGLDSDTQWNTNLYYRKP